VKSVTESETSYAVDLVFLNSIIVIITIKFRLFEMADS